VLAVQFTGEEVLQAIGLEPNGAAEEVVLVGAGVVPDRDVRRVLERAATIGVGGAVTAASPAGPGSGGVPASCGSGRAYARGRRAPGKTLDLAVANRPARHLGRRQSGRRAARPDS
jgi:hypothetical protein